MPFVKKYVYLFVFFCILNCMIPIGYILKDLRKKKGLSLRALDRKINISFNTLSAYERNVVQPTLENCYKMSRFFEIPIEYLILGEKAKKDFKDPELLSLFHEVENFKKKDREMIKKYIKKFVKARKELEELKTEAE